MVEEKGLNAFAILNKHDDDDDDEYKKFADKKIEKDKEKEPVNQNVTA